MTDSTPPSPRHTPALPLPDGAVQLGLDDAVERLITRNHNTQGKGYIPDADQFLIDVLALGLIVAAELPDGQLCFAPSMFGKPILEHLRDTPTDEIEGI